MIRILRPVFFILALTVLLVAYYWVHKPLDLALIESFGGLILDAMTVTACILLTGALGMGILMRWGTEAKSEAEQIALASGFGLGLYSIVALILGLVGLFQPVVLWGVLLVLALIHWRGLLRFAAILRSLFRKAIRIESGWNGFVAVVAWFTIITALLLAFAPPLAWDSLAYHLISPARYIESGRIEGFDDNAYLGLSQGVEVLYGVLMAPFGRDTTTAPLHWWFGVIGVLACAGLVRRYANRTAGWFAVIIPLSAYSFWWLMSIPYVDLAVFAYAALVLVCMVAFREAEDEAMRHRWIVLAGAASGLAMAVKYTAALLIGVIGVHLLRLDRRRVLVYGLLAGAVMALVFLPWALRGVLLFQNPVYPLFFNGLNWDGLRASYLNPPNSGFLYYGQIGNLLLLPLAATVFGVQGGVGFSFTAGLWLLTLPMALVFCWGALPKPARMLTKDALFTLGPLLLAWMVLAAYYGVSAQTRLMTMVFPAFIVAGALAVYGLSRLPIKPVNVYFVFQIIFAFTLALGAFQIMEKFLTHQPVHYYLSPSDSRDTYVLRDPLTARLYQAMMNIDTLVDAGDLPEQATVRFLFEPRSYYCPERLHCLGDETLDHWRYPVQRGIAPEAVLTEWRDNNEYLLLDAQGFTLLLADAGNENSLFQGLELLEPLVDDWLTPVWSDGVRYTLYTWR